MSSRISRIAIVAMVTLAFVTPPTMSWAVGDGPLLPPPDYGDFNPGLSTFPTVGESYVDPVFGTTVTRLTAEYPEDSNSDLYSKNGFWNADATLIWHRAGPDDYRIIRATHGRDGRRAGDVVRMNVPGNADGSFAPDDPDVWYYISGATLLRYSVRSGKSSEVRTFSKTLGSLGASTDWIDRSGRYMLLMIGRALHVYDKSTDSLYTGAIHSTVDTGWAGISPDGQYVVVAGDQQYSYAVDHERRRVSTKGVMFWSLCGDHGDLVSTTTGKTYMVTFECYSEAAVYAVDVSLPQSTLDLDQQRAQNRKLFETDWNDSGHFSAVSKGPMKNWVFVSVESSDDVFGRPVDASWWNRPYMQEIVMANVVTGEVRRLAHHRSRSVDLYYRAQPRLSVSWDGRRVMWGSNFGKDTSTEYCDIYALDVAGREDEQED